MFDFLKVEKLGVYNLAVKDKTLLGWGVVTDKIVGECRAKRNS